MVRADGRTHTRRTSDPSFDGATGERRAPPGPCVRSVVRRYGLFDGTGYGFISTDDGDLDDEDVFFHMEDVGGEGLTEGTDVEFDIESSPEGPAWRTSFDSNTGIHLSLTLTNTDSDFLDDQARPIRTVSSITGENSSRPGRAIRLALRDSVSKMLCSFKYRPVVRLLQGASRPVWDDR